VSGPEHWPEEGPGEFEDSGGAGIPPFLLDPAGIVRRRWLWMLATLILGAVASVAVGATWKHRFAAEAKVIINSQQIPKEFVRSTVAESSLAYLNAAVGKVLSRANLDRIIDEVGLYGSIVYRLVAKGDDPKKAAAVANALSALLLKATLEQRTDQARNVTRFLRQALEEDERELRAHSQQISEFRVKHRGQLPSDLVTNLRKLDLREERREDVSAELASAIARLEGASSVPGARLETENEQLLDALRRQLASELASHTEDHPNVISLRRQVLSFEESVAAELSGDAPVSAARLAQQREIQMMRRKLVELDAQMDELSERVDQIPIVAEKLAALEQKETVLREDYLSSLRKVEDAELAETLEVAQHGAHIEVLERARPPDAPEQSRWLVLAVGLLLSLATSMGIGVLFELLDPVLLVARQIEEVAERPVIGSLPRVSS
jgi:uncharacterized protein involved in exopolysaccharide biosynthesis